VTTTYVITVFIGGGGALVALVLLIGREVAALGPIFKWGMRAVLWLGATQFVIGVADLTIRMLARN
jgi:hypothetical protein